MTISVSRDVSSMPWISVALKKARSTVLTKTMATSGQQHEIEQRHDGAVDPLEPARHRCRGMPRLARRDGVEHRRRCAARGHSRQAEPSQHGQPSSAGMKTKIGNYR